MASFLNRFARYLLPALLVCAALVLFLDVKKTTPDGRAAALRTMEPAVTDESEGTVDAICGFAPCGMPIACE
jgi:hypothetical protein